MSEVQLPTGYKTIDVVSSVYSYKSNSKARIVQKDGGGLLITTLNDFRHSHISVEE
jgi:hypothetical protein